MTHNGDDIDLIIPVTSTLLRSVNIKLIKSNVGPIAEEQWQRLYGHKPYHYPILTRTVPVLTCCIV